VLREIDCLKNVARLDRLCHICGEVEQSIDWRWTKSNWPKIVEMARKWPTAHI